MCRQAQALYLPRRARAAGYIGTELGAEEFQSVCALLFGTFHDDSLSFLERGYKGLSYMDDM